MIACWPKVQLSVPDYREHYFVPWSEFPESLKQDIESYLHRQASEDLLSDFELKPLRPRSVKTRLRQFHQCGFRRFRPGIPG
jgi:hypothetical protein